MIPAIRWRDRNAVKDVIIHGIVLPDVFESLIVAITPEMITHVDKLFIGLVFVAFLGHFRTWFCSPYCCTPVGFGFCRDRIIWARNGSLLFEGEKWVIVVVIGHFDVE